MAIFAAAAPAELGSREKNLKQMLEYIEKAAEKKTDLILFPELVLGVPACGMNSITSEAARMERARAELIPEGETVQLMIEQAKKHNMYICWSMSERDRERVDVLYNTAVLVGPEGYVGKYSKSHTVLCEKFIYNAGNEYRVFDTRLGRIGVIVCYDLNFPEPSRIMMLKGAQLIICPTAWGCAEQDDNAKGDFHRYDIIRQARALENMVPVITSSFGGYWDPRDKSHGTATGHSSVISAGGDILAQTGWEPGIAFAELDIEKDMLEARYDSMHMANLVKDRRPDLYGEIVRINKYCPMIQGLEE